MVDICVSSPLQQPLRAVGLAKHWTDILCAPVTNRQAWPPLLSAVLFYRILLLEAFFGEGGGGGLEAINPGGALIAHRTACRGFFLY